MPQTSEERCNTLWSWHGRTTQFSTSAPDMHGLGNELSKQSTERLCCALLVGSVVQHPPSRLDCSREPLGAPYVSLMPPPCFREQAPVALGICIFDARRPTTFMLILTISYIHSQPNPRVIRIHHQKHEKNKKMLCYTIKTQSISSSP